ncbi:nuclease-related domain-containing protein (plasmid) [Kribbella sp. WER1]
MTYQLNRWQEYGHDRLYVNSGSRKVGWIDLKTGRSTSTTDTGWPHPVEGMVKHWLANNGLEDLQVQLAPRRFGDEVTTQEFLARLDQSRNPAPADNVRGRATSSGARGTEGTQQPDPAGQGWDLAKNRPGSSAQAAARKHTTWWRQLGRALGFRTKDQAWRIGAEGEQLVAQTLRWARLRGWRILHAVPVGTRGADIDHVLIGPGGVITINTKHHPGKKVRAKPDVVFVGKDAKKYGQISQHEATRAARLLTAAADRPVSVRAAVVVVGAKSVRGSRSAGTEVMPRSHLLVWLLFQRRVLGRTEVARLYEIARRSTTWTPG